ncbi:MAG: YDG domain-containing protein, partial [Veillonellales bacterium]
LGDNTTGVINQKSITVSASTDSKTYDGTKSSTATPTASWLATGDTLSASQEYADKNAGNNKTLTVTSYSIDDGNHGNNYSVTLEDNTNGVINQKSITVSASTDSKTYDGTKVSTAAPTASWLATGDTLSGSQEYADKNAGSNKTLTVTSYSIDDGNHGNNYSVTVGDNTTGIINQKSVTVSASTDSKAYDGTKASTAAPTVNGLITGDVLTSAVQEYADKNAGNNKTLTVTSYSIDDGNHGNNYSVTLGDNTTGVINQKSITVSASTDSKTYDGTKSSIAAPTASWLAAGDTLSASQEYADKNAGSNKTLTVASYRINDGNQGNNYSVTLEDSTNGAIAPKGLTVSANGQNKLCDGSTEATVTYSDNRISGDNLNISGTAQFIDPNAGANKIITISGIRISGNDASNYSLLNTSATATATIYSAIYQTEPYCAAVIAASHSDVFDVNPRNRQMVPVYRDTSQGQADGYLSQAFLAVIPPGVNMGGYISISGQTLGETAE